MPARASIMKSLPKAQKHGQSTVFIEFMLNTIWEEIKEYSLDTPQVALQDTHQVKKLLAVLNGEMTRREILNALKLSDRKSITERYLRPALTAGLIKITIPDNPTAEIKNIESRQKEIFLWRYKTMESKRQGQTSKVFYGLCYAYYLEERTG